MRFGHVPAQQGCSAGTAVRFRKVPAQKAFRKALVQIMRSSSGRFRKRTTSGFAHQFLQAAEPANCKPFVDEMCVGSAPFLMRTCCIQLPSQKMRIPKAGFFLLFSLPRARPSFAKTRVVVYQFSRFSLHWKARQEENLPFQRSLKDCVKPSE